MLLIVLARINEVERAAVFIAKFAACAPNALRISFEVVPVAGALDVAHWRVVFDIPLWSVVHGMHERRRALLRYDRCKLGRGELGINRRDVIGRLVCALRLCALDVAHGSSGSRLSLGENALDRLVAN